jgi:hypothetical protein
MAEIAQAPARGGWWRRISQEHDGLPWSQGKCLFCNNFFTTSYHLPKPTPSKTLAGVSQGLWDYSAAWTFQSPDQGAANPPRVDSFVPKGLNGIQSGRFNRGQHSAHDSDNA